jgi:Xaa-Pro aminopeptidase
VTTDLTHRIKRAQQQAAEAGIDALLVSPGADLRYLTGYNAPPLERLTALVIPADGEAILVVPTLERPAALASPAGSLDLRVADWEETADPYRLVASLLPSGVATIAVDNQMSAEKVLKLRAALPGAAQVLAGEVLGPLRMRKAPEEVAALREAGQAIDRVHLRMGEWLRADRSEREVAQDIAEAIVEEGHVRADFVIVASGSNGASPHHEVSDRTIQTGDPVVVDIGGTMASGYCSDCTRNYVVGGKAAPEYEAYFEVLRTAQQQQCEYAGPGVTAESVDAVGREIISMAGYGEAFMHRTGHGIGLETHEEPYIVAGNTLVLEEGMAFSIEPGIYLSGRHGARIEDIVVCNAGGVERLNTTIRDIRRLDG